MFLLFLWIFGIKVHHQILTAWWVINYKWVILFHYFLRQRDVTSQNQQGRHLKEYDSCLFNGPTYEPSTTCPEKDRTNLPSKNYHQWTDSAFLATAFLPIYPLSYWSNTISRKLPTKTTSDMHYILPKLRDWVVFKEDDKILCHKKRRLYQHWTGFFVR